MSLRRLRTDLAAAGGLLTRLPMGRLMPRDPRIDMAAAVWAFPLAGALVGLCGGGAYAFASLLRLPPLLGGCWTLLATLLLTGALHEDGLADIADGFGGGRGVARKLAIMRDSQVGSYGVLALALSSLLRVAAVARLQSPAAVCCGLVVSGALSRAGIVLLLVLLPPARRDGIAASLHPIPRLPALSGWGLALVLDAALLRGWPMLAAPVCGLLATVLLARLSRRQVGGHTGDVLGACSVLVECAVLSALLSAPLGGGAG